jgi:hypothetical protein
MENIIVEKKYKLKLRDDKNSEIVFNVEYDANTWCDVPHVFMTITIEKSMFEIFKGYIDDSFLCHFDKDHTNKKIFDPYHTIVFKVGNMVINEETMTDYEKALFFHFLKKDFDAFASLALEFM